MRISIFPIEEEECGKLAHFFLLPWDALAIDELSPHCSGNTLCLTRRDRQPGRGSGLQVLSSTLYLSRIPKICPVVQCMLVIEKEVSVWSNVLCTFQDKSTPNKDYLAKKVADVLWSTSVCRCFSLISGCVVHSTIVNWLHSVGCNDFFTAG